MSDGAFDHHDLLGVLAREGAVRLLNCSPSGCLLEATSPLDIGTVASLKVNLMGGEFVDTVRVVRCQPIAGAGSVFHIGAQFLWTATPGAQSLRRIMRRAGSTSEPGLSRPQRAHL